MLVSNILSPHEKQAGLFPTETNAVIHYQLQPETLMAQTMARKQGVLNNTRALCVNTGRFTGRCPKERFIVKDNFTEKKINWGGFNNPIDEKYFTQLHSKMLRHLAAKKEIWIRDCFACADENYRLNLRVINENAWSNLFCYNMFLRPQAAELENFSPDWHIIQAPDFFANPEVDGTTAPHFIIISFEKQTILIGGTAYTGEMKKGIFSVLNFLLPVKNNVLTMHCSANLGAENDVALFFGLSGTGKTTLSADASRLLIGDDEHAWTNEGIFNIEGGCYAKLIGLEKEKEPLIFNAIRSGALVENCSFINNTNRLDFASADITENTRASYPLSYIANAVHPSLAGMPENIFFLTCDAYGILPPISKLSIPQAMYYFISGYTAKVAGTETGVTEPKATFSACFGAPFIPLHPARYAEMLGEKIKQHNVKVWMINTGWTTGAYGKGYRIPLAYTREIVKAVLNNELENATYITDSVFNLNMPLSCSSVPTSLLNPRETWEDKSAYDTAAAALAKQFAENFLKYKNVDETICLAGPSYRA